MRWRQSQKSAFGARPRFTGESRRFATIRVVIVLTLVLIIARLFTLQVLGHEFYRDLASGQHGIVSELYPKRGSIYLRDPDAANGVFPVAVNKSLGVAYADGRKIEDAAGAAKSLAPILGLDEAALTVMLSQKEDPYIPLKRRLPAETVDAIRGLELPGVSLTYESYRYYPEQTTACHVLGFVGSAEDGSLTGRYGVEGRLEKELAGTRGYLSMQRDPGGRWISSAERRFEPAVDGSDIVLTIDRNIQHAACSRLREAVVKHRATGGAVVVLEPKTGRVLAMCGAPEFDPNAYSDVENSFVFNNPATFLPYEPGSIFKAITMAAALDAGKVSPNTTYVDAGVEKIAGFSIRNSDGKANGVQTMTQVLEKSLNTGTIFLMRQVGPATFRDYVERFGFGELTGVELDTEMAGDVTNLKKRGEIYAATGSYGQGITATALQMATAYGALANGGQLMRPYVIEERRQPGGVVVKTEPKVVRQAVSPRTASQVAAMLVNVVENGHGKRAGVPGYYVAGKTGTAEIPGAGGYEEGAFIGSFVGFAPVDSPAFVMAVRIDRPQDVEWAESSAAPLFGDIAKFLLQYMKIPPERE